MLSGLHTRLMDGVCDHLDFMIGDFTQEQSLPHPSSLKRWIENASEVMAHYDGLEFPRCPLDKPVIRLAQGLFALACMPGGVTFHCKHYEFTKLVTFEVSTTTKDGSV